MTACKTIRVLAHYPPHPEIGLPLHTPVDKQTSVPRALGKNLFRQWASLWTFLKHEQIELTNNPAERVIRSTVLIRKTNGNTASELGKTFVANLQSVLATAATMSCSSRFRAKSVGFVRAATVGVWLSRLRIWSMR